MKKIHVIRNLAITSNHLAFDFSSIDQVVTIKNTIIKYALTIRDVNHITELCTRIYKPAVKGGGGL